MNMFACFDFTNKPHPVTIWAQLNPSLVKVMGQGSSLSPHAGQPSYWLISDLVWWSFLSHSSPRLASVYHSEREQIVHIVIFCHSTTKTWRTGGCLASTSVFRCCARPSSTHWWRARCSTTATGASASPWASISNRWAHFSNTEQHNENTVKPSWNWICSLFMFMTCLLMCSVGLNIMGRNIHKGVYPCWSHGVKPDW